MLWLCLIESMPNQKRNGGLQYEENHVASISIDSDAHIVPEYGICRKWQYLSKFLCNMWRVNRCIFQTI